MKATHSLLYPIFVVSLFLSCNKDKKEISHKVTDSTNTKKIEYTFDDGKKQIPVKLNTPPQRAAVFTPYMTEMLLALGLESRMVMGSTEGEILPQLAKAYQKVPHKQIGHSFRITKEAFLLLNADFVSGDDDIKPETTGSVEDLIQAGVAPFIAKSKRVENATMEDVYDDFLELGKIFDVQEKAKTLVKNMKDKLDTAQKTFKNRPDAEKPRVMIMTSFNNGIWISSSLATDLINKANGKPVYEDISSSYELVTFESAVHRNPDFIFLADIQSRGMSVKEKIDLLKTHPILKNINAVKNNKIYQISLADVTPGVRNIDFIIKMNELIYR
ncbi:MAG: ABC transporter substrate-binding protein [Cloacibacterium sp.]|nr:ABC transporter substrate-binding protein [Cloacibacterium sp.]